MSAWSSPAVEAKRRLNGQAALTGGVLVEPDSAVDDVFAILEEPDGDMIRAGVRALADAGRTPRETVCAVWAAMIRAAQE